MKRKLMISMKGILKQLTTNTTKTWKEKDNNTAVKTDGNNQTNNTSRKTNWRNLSSILNTQTTKHSRQAT